MSSRLVYTTRTGNPNHADMVALIHAASCARCAIARFNGDASGDCSERAPQERAPQYLSLSCDGPCCVKPKVAMCRSTTPEPHERGEFPMSCYACHMVADA